MEKVLKEQDMAIDFTLPDENGQLHSLHDYKGKTVVLYFYPKDDTPGCTVEACGFRDNHSKITSKGAIVIGISKDSPKSHEKFKTKYNLPFILLSDEKAEVIEKYGAWAEKNMYGKKVFGTLRKTFVIDKDGKIKKIFEKVTPDGHADEIINYL